jgi:hypothetical protein
VTRALREIRTSVLPTGYTRVPDATLWKRLGCSAVFSLILLPDVAEPLGLGALSGVENRRDDGHTSVGMKRDWTSTQGVHRLNSGCWSVPLLND